MRFVDWPKRRPRRSILEVPLLETDLIWAYLNREDRYHDNAKTIFSSIKQGVRYSVSSLSLIELELIYKSNHLEEHLARHIAALSTLPNISYANLSVDIVLSSIYLRMTHGLSFFDSHYAATALQGDAQIMSTDQAYEKVPGLKRLNPENIK